MLFLLVLATQWQEEKLVVLLEAVAQEKEWHPTMAMREWIPFPTRLLLLLLTKKMELLVKRKKRWENSSSRSNVLRMAM